MEKKLITLLILLMPLFNGSMAQSDNPLSKKYMLKSTLTIASGILLNHPSDQIYLHGHLEYYPEEKVSLRGDSFFGLRTSGSDPGLWVNHSIQFGAMYHFLKGKFDPYVGFQPGVNISKTGLYFSPDVGVAVSPALSISAGINYFVSRYFNFFLSAGYYQSSLVRIMSNPVFSYLMQEHSKVRMEEIRLSAGLGFNLALKK